MSYSESLQVVKGQLVAEQVEESILQHTSVAVPVTISILFCGVASDWAAERRREALFVFFANDIPQPMLSGRLTIGQIDLC